MADTKVCSKCGIEKAVKEFRGCKKRGKYRASCHSCERSKWREKAKKRLQKHGIMVSCARCGKEVLKDPKEIKRYKTHFCSRACGTRGVGGFRKDLAGRRFGRLVVKEYVGKRGTGYFWLCKCDCGSSKMVRSGRLKTGSTKSCGCYREDYWRNQNGGRYKTKAGYIIIYKPGHPLASKNGQVTEHRWVAAEYWGLEAVKSAIVHHKNGIRHDNRIENLELRTSHTHWKGQTVEDMTEWAIEYLSVHAPELLKNA